MNENGSEITSLAPFHQLRNHHQGSGTKTIGESDRRIKIGASEVKLDTVADSFGRSSVEDNSEATEELQRGK